MTNGGSRLRVGLLMTVIILLTGAIAGIQVMIGRKDDHEPFRRVGPPDPRATLPETLDWIKTAIQGTEVDYAFQLQAGTLQSQERYEEMKYDGCRVSVKITDTSYDTSGYDLSFNLAELSDIGRPIAMGDDGRAKWKIPLQSAGSRDAIEERSEHTDYTSFTAFTPDMAQRLANAFNHAIRLCRKAQRAGPPVADRHVPEPHARSIL
jgi:hypothetical protein